MADSVIIYYVEVKENPTPDKWYFNKEGWKFHAIQVKKGDLYCFAIVDQAGEDYVAPKIYLTIRQRDTKVLKKFTYTSTTNNLWHFKNSLQSVYK